MSIQTNLPTAGGGARLIPEYMEADMRVYPVSEDKLNHLSFLSTITSISFTLVGISLSAVGNLWWIGKLEPELTSDGAGWVRQGIVLGTGVAIIFGVAGTAAMWSRWTNVRELKKNARIVTLKPG